MEVKNLKIKTFSSPVLMLYLAWCVGISAFILGSFVQIAQEFLAVNYNFATEIVAVITQVAFQWLFMLNSTWKERRHYMFIALSASMIGSLMLIPLILINAFYSVSITVAIVYFIPVAAAIFIIHHRLIKLLMLPQILSVSWILYPVLLLAFVSIPR